MQVLYCCLFLRDSSSYTSGSLGAMLITTPPCSSSPSVHHPSQLVSALDVISAFSPLFTCNDHRLAAASDQLRPDTLILAALSELLMPEHASEGTSAVSGDPSLLFHHSTADRAALLNLCGGLSERRILGRDAQLCHMTLPLLQARLDRRIGQPQVTSDRAPLEAQVS